MRARRALCLLPLGLLLCAAPPTPESHFGFKPGADRQSATWRQITGYYQALAQSSPRVRVAEYGKSAEGRPLIVATISSEENLRRLDEYRSIQQQLADPRRTPAAAAEKLIAAGKTVVLITCSIHATEVAANFTAVEYAYRLATATGGKSQAILDNVILLLVPSLNPDGLDLVTEWYRKTLGTPFEGTSPPRLYQKYTGHDNNRDWYIFSQPETRATISQLHNVWHPQIVYDVHQMSAAGARMFVPPWLDPIEPNIDPILVQQSNMIGMTMASDLTAAGRKGVLVNAMYDFWTPARHYQAYHAGMRILSESASARLYSPLPDSTGGGRAPAEQRWNYLEPWTGGPWRVRDIMDDQLIAWESLLHLAAVKRVDFLRNFYRLGAHAVARKSPAAFVVPFQQADPGATRRLLETLAFGQVEIERAAQSFVIRMQQPYSGFAKTLLERQRYPDLRQYPGGPPQRPYDVTAHTLPLLMGVDVRTVEQPLKEKLAPARDFGGIRGASPLSDTDYWRTPAARKQTRVALYKSHMPNMDEGWTRWMLDQFGWPYTSVANRDLQAGNLRSRFDAIVFPAQSSAAIHSGFSAGAMPAEYTGGVDESGAAALRKFTAEGGRLIFLNQAGAYAVEHLGVKARNALEGVSSRDFYCPGSLLNVKLQPGSPLGRGLPAEFTVWMEDSPVWESAEAAVPLRYAASNVLASGWLLGEKHVAGKPALLDVPLGQGCVILFGFRPQYRAQSYLTLKLFFNALVY